jgi:hypothetical protein
MQTIESILGVWRAVMWMTLLTTPRIKRIECWIRMVQYTNGWLVEYCLNKTMRPSLLITILIAGCFSAMSQTKEPPKKSRADVMRELRLKMLTTPPAEFGQQPTPEYPHVCGVLMDWPIDAATVSVVSLSTGDASIYTTGTFGVLGGIGHESVRNAARRFVRLGEKHLDEATVTKDYPYPKAGRVRFYLVCYDGVRTLEADLESVKAGKDKCSDMFIEGQRVIAELRMITQKQKVQTP